MRRAKVEAGLVIFLLFFGTAMVDAVQRRAWATSIIYLLLALLFLTSGVSRRDAGGAERGG
jgi:hypothetical protein